MGTNEQDDAVMSLKESATACGVTMEKILGWAKQGELILRWTADGQVKVRLSDLKKCIESLSPATSTGLPEQVKKIRVLVIDDDKLIIRGLHRAFECAGTFEVQFAYDGLSAELKFNEFEPDVVIIDYKMPAMKGDVLIKRLNIHNIFHRIGRAPRVIVYSGNLSRENEKHFRKLGVTACMDKSMDVDELIRYVKKIVVQG